MARIVSGLAGSVAVAALCGACASSGTTAGGTPTPRPFPAPGGSRSSPVPPALPAPAAPTFDGYALVGTALALRGTPYRNGGADPRGFDCSGFTQYVFARYGIALGRGVRDQFRQGQEIETADLAAGDLVFFTTTEPGASHVAIAIGGNQFVHAPSSSGVVRVERLSSSYWSQRYVGARRIAPAVTTQQ